MRRYSLHLLLFLALVLASACDKKSTNISEPQSDKPKAPVEVEVTNPKAGTPEDVVRRVLIAGLDPNEATGFAKYLKLVHTSFRDTPNGIKMRRTFEWPRLRKQAIHYVKSKSDPSFIITRRGISQNSLRLFVKWRNGKGLPKPIVLQKDPKDGNRWRVIATSL
ncbi:MAG: hypothetical protein KC609_16900 [Myxococcales bacterium]|nr:hypothetical protein [Myxococcales bacterium]